MVRIVILSALILAGFAARAAHDQSGMTVPGDQPCGQSIGSLGHRPP